MRKNWKSPYEFYFRALDEDGKVRYESVFQQDCLNYITSKYEKDKRLFSMEQLPVHFKGEVLK